MKKLPYILGMYPGVGIGPFTGTIYPSPFSDISLWSPKDLGGQDLEFNLQLITSKSDLLHKIAFDASLFLPTNPAISGSLSAGFSKLSSFTSQKVCILVSLVVTNSAELITKHPLTSEAKQILKETGMSRFCSLYGTGFVAGQAKGGFFYAVIEVNAIDNEDCRSLSARIAAETSLCFTGALDAGDYLSKLIGNRSTNVTVLQSGGQAFEPSLSVEQVLDAVRRFPAHVVENPTIPYLFFKEYRQIPEFALRQHEDREQLIKLNTFLEQLEDSCLTYRRNAEALLRIRELNDSGSFLRNGINNESNLSFINNDLIGVNEYIERLITLYQECQLSGRASENLPETYQMSSYCLQLIDGIRPGTESNDTNESFRKLDRPDSLESWSHTQKSMKEYYNVAIVGQTGVGKSTLLNYLFGEQVAKTGIGKPVTERGFSSWETFLGDLPIRLFDSWGLEANKAQEWMALLDRELSRRGTNEPVPSWFHTVIYCISAINARIQDVDAEIIMNFYAKKYNVIVVLTKSELMQSEELATLESAIKSSTHRDIALVRVCSRQHKLGNHTFDTFGKIELRKAISRNFWSSILMRVPERCQNVLVQRIDRWEKQSLDLLSAFRSSDLQEAFKRMWRPPNAKEVRQVIHHEVTQALALYGRVEEAILSSSIIKTDTDSAVDTDDFQAPFLSVSKPIQKATIITGLGGIGGTVASVASVAGGASLITIFPFAAIAVAGIWISSMISENDYEKARGRVTSYATKFRSRLTEIDSMVRDSLAELQNLDCSQ